MEEPLSIHFDYFIEGYPRAIHLTAIAEIHHSEEHYVVSNVKAHADRPALPDFDIKKLDGKWVHIDSEKETYLSRAAGNAIDVALSFKAAGIYQG
jgi:hypothetical protein